MTKEYEEIVKERKGSKHNRLELFVGTGWTDLTGEDGESIGMSRHLDPILLDSKYQYFIAQQEGIKVLLYRREKDDY